MIAADNLGRLALFADLSTPQLAALAQRFDEDSYQRGDRVLRQGFAGSAFYVIAAGEASVRIDGTERARLLAGDFFGEVSILLGEPPVADVVAASAELRCAVLPGAELAALLIEYPPLALRMLKAEALRLRNANLWRG